MADRHPGSGSLRPAAAKPRVEMSTVSVDNFVGKRRHKRADRPPRGTLPPMLKNRAPKN
jgi:hypothetical protein